MNIAQMQALMEWLRKEIEKLQPDVQETDIGKPSTMELAQRARREQALANRPVATTGTLQGELEAAEVPTVPGKGLTVIPPREQQARVYQYKNVPNIQVDPSGEARIISDLSDSIRRYREMKTGMEPTGISQRDIIARRTRPGANLPGRTEYRGKDLYGEHLEGIVAQPERYLTPTPEQKFQTTDTQKRAAQLRKALADLKQGRRRLQGRMGLPFNPKIWNRSLIPAGGPTDAFKRMMDRRSR